MPQLHPARNSPRRFRHTRMHRPFEGQSGRLLCLLPSDHGRTSEVHPNSDMFDNIDLLRCYGLWIGFRTVCSCGVLVLE